MLDNSLRDNTNYIDIPPRAKDEVSLLCREIAAVAGGIRENTSRLKNLRERRHELLLGLVHDLRGPIAGLLAAVELLRRDWQTISADMYSSLCSAMKAGIAAHKRYLEHLTEAQLLSLEQREIEHSPVNIEAIAREVIARGTPHALALGVSLHLDSTGDHFSIPGDASLLDRLFSNLIDNALQYTPPGGQVKISLSGQIDRVAVVVSDTGSGIDEADLSLVFEAFFRGAEKSVRNKSGAGLGLALVRKIVELHGSTISVRSRKNEGTSFHFQLVSAARCGEASAVKRSETFTVKRVVPEWMRPAELGWLHTVCALLLVSASYGVSRPYVQVAASLMICLVTLIWRHPPELRPAAKTKLLGLLWAAGLVSIHEGVSGGLVLTPFAFLFYCLSTLECLRHYRDRSGVFFAFAALSSGFIGFVRIEHFGLPLLGVISGISLGLFLHHGFLPNRIYGLIFRVIGVFCVLGIVLCGWQTFFLNEEWKLLAWEMPPASSLSIAEAIRENVLENLPAANADVFNLSNESPRFFFSIWNFVALNPFQESYLVNDRQILNLNGIDDDAPAIYAGLLARSIPEVLTEEVLRVSMTDFARSAIVKIVPARLSLSVVFASPLSRILIRKTAQPYLVVYSCVSILAGYLIIMLFFLLLGPGLRHTVEELRSSVHGLRSGGEHHPLLEGTVSTPSIMPALANFAREVNRRSAEYISEDTRTRELVIGAVNELSAFLRQIEVHVQQCASRERQENGTKPPAYVIGLETLLQAEKRTVDLLFELTRQGGKALDVTRSVFNLQEVIDEAIIDTIAFSQLKVVSLHADIDPLLTIESDKELLAKFVMALLHYTLSSLPRGSRLDIRHVLREDATGVDILFNASCAKSGIAPAELFEEDAEAGGEMKASSFSEIAAEEIMRVLGSRLVRESLPDAVLAFRVCLY